MSGNNTNQEKTALIYCRVSSEKQEREGVSLQVQENLCREWAAQNGFRVAEVVYETASASHYPSKQRLLQQIIARDTVTFSHLLVYSVSRFCRHLQGGIEMSNALLSKGIQLVSQSENLFGSATNEDQFRFVQLLNHADLERKLISKRVRDTLQNLKNQGHSLGRPKFGFQATVNLDRKRIFTEYREELLIIKLVQLLRRPKTSLLRINDLLFTLTGDEECCIELDDGEEQLARPMPFANIAKVFNEIGLTKRGKSFTEASVQALATRKLK